MKHLPLLLLLTINTFSFGQADPPTAVGGEYLFESTECVPEALRLYTVQRLKRNTDSLKQIGVIPEEHGRSISSFVWPVQQASTEPYNNYYGISNYVDHDPTTGNLQDYACGERTYDLNSGYDHRGTDIFLWPFSWHMVNDNRVEVIAAAAGVIIDKQDGNVDTNCDFSNPNWNAVFVRHSDGTVTWYGHLKNGSVTNKAVGQSVAAGEYLGIVASSGSSTGPHLHFEVWEDDSYTNLLDPYDGPCNDLNSSSMWVNQQNYREPTINHVMTNSNFPVFNDCPQPASMNEKSVFLQGETVYFSAYFRDHLLNDQTQLRIIQPNGSTWSNWTHTNNGNYNASWWSWFWNFPGTEPLGVWTFEVSFMGQVQTAEFTITNTLPVELTNFRGEQVEKSVALSWETLSEEGNSHFSVQRSQNSRDFTTIGRVDAAIELAAINNYDFADNTPLTGRSYYRLEQVDLTGESSFSDIISIDYRDAQGSELSVYPNPISLSQLTIDNPSVVGATSVSVLNAGGALLETVTGLGTGTTTLPLSLKPGVYFLRFTTPSGDKVKRILVQ